MMNLELEAMALAMPEVAKHPNRLPFHGVLTLVGIASQRPPSGARGHRVMLTRKATETALPSLLGMALDYAPALDAHDARRKIGIITEAEIVPMRSRRIGQPAPTAARLRSADTCMRTTFRRWWTELRAGQWSRWGCRTRSRTRMWSSPASPIWTVTSFTFTGAAVLRREKAAYPETWIAGRSKQLAISS